MSSQTSSADTGVPYGQPKVDHDSFAALASTIYEDCLENIIHDIVREVHREEKLARMRTAAILVEKAASALPAPEVSSNDEAPASPAQSRVITTDGAVGIDGKIYLKGNPLETIKEILCPKCHLPRLLHPTTGNGAVAPDPSVTYCSREPPIIKDRHDIYGRPFPKEKKGKAQSQADRAVNGANQDTPGSSPRDAGETKATTPAIPSVKCPNCAKYLPVIRIAKHIMNCMGYGGRLASRSAMAKMASQNGTSSTPSTSRLGTPVPGARDSPDKRYRDDDDDDDDEEEETPKKKRKKIIRKPTEKAQPTKKKLNGQQQTSKTQPNSRPQSVDRGERAGTKRERDEGETGTETPVKKKLKRPIDGISGSPLAKSNDVKGTNGISRVRDLDADRNGGAPSSPTSGNKAPGGKDGIGTLKKRKLEVNKNNESHRDDRIDESFEKRKKSQSSESLASVVGA